mmetsp:Transcript_3179/g.9697  ORF Transcript_3179/g.9697 Transcript_3179/m.9697 type:complete len:268 (+) Transcript_3179:664-1467(+)
MALSGERSAFVALSTLWKSAYDRSDRKLFWSALSLADVKTSVAPAWCARYRSAWHKAFIPTRSPLAKRESLSESASQWFAMISRGTAQGSVVRRSGCSALSVSPFFAALRLCHSPKFFRAPSTSSSAVLESPAARSWPNTFWTCFLNSFSQWHVTGITFCGFDKSTTTAKTAVLRRVVVTGMPTRSSMPSPFMPPADARGSYGHRCLLLFAASEHAGFVLLSGGDVISRRRRDRAARTIRALGISTWHLAAGPRVASRNIRVPVHNG